jgi:glycogen synthase
MSNQRILMFGWEYAPFYSGGLGIVTRSIIQNLKQKGLDIVFVLPKMPNTIQEDKIQFINASEIKLRKKDKTYISEIEIETILSPYMTKQMFKQELITTILENSNEPSIDQKSIYGTNLIEEVENYANKAAKIAKKYKHDIIHTHDWMTSRAGMIAKQISHKPLVMHVHATEIERSGFNPNQDVFNIEKEGYTQADKIIAVSELTKQRIVQYYGIDPDKIFVVHNAIDKFQMQRD